MLDQSGEGRGQNATYVQVCELLLRPHHKHLALTAVMHFYVDVSAEADLNFMFV